MPTPPVRPTTLANFLQEETGLRVGADATDRLTAILTQVTEHVAATAAASARAEDRTTLLERDVNDAFETFLREEGPALFSPATLFNAIDNVDNDGLTQLITLLRADLQPPR